LIRTIFTSSCRIRLIVLLLRAMNGITMTKKLASSVTKQQAIENTPELREALVWAAIGWVTTGPPNHKTTMKRPIAKLAESWQNLPCSLVRRCRPKGASVLSALKDYFQSWSEVATRPLPVTYR